MPRAHKSTEDQFFDVFASWPVADQKIALKVMERLVTEREKDEKRVAKAAPKGNE